MAGTSSASSSATAEAHHRTRERAAAVEPLRWVWRAAAGYGSVPLLRRGRVSAGDARRKLAGVVPAIAAVVVSGCSLDLFGPDQDVAWYNRRPMQDPPLELYARIYAEVEACWRARGVATPGDFGRIRWFEADSVIVDGKFARAVTVIPGHDVAFVTRWRENPVTIGHELSHEASQRGRSIHYAGASRAICDGGAP